MLAVIYRYQLCQKLKTQQWMDLYKNPPTKLFKMAVWVTHLRNLNYRLKTLNTRSKHQAKAHQVRLSVTMQTLADR